jgi:hypothetical protein
VGFYPTLFTISASFWGEVVSFLWHFP